MPNNAPRRLVEFSATALTANLDALFRVDPDSVVDLRCDAYGHGSDWVETHARRAGFTAFVTEDSPTADIPSSCDVIYGIAAGERIAVVSSEIIAVKDIAVGETVSYGNTWTATRPTRLGLVALGFADGLPRAGSNSAHLLVADTTAPVVGRIAMDQCVLDITDVPANVGDIVYAWDSIESITEWATVSRRHALSLVAGLSWRVERRWTP